MRSKTTEVLVPKKVIVEKTESGEAHVYEDGKGHVATPLCFCVPHLSIADVTVWCHFPDNMFLKIALDLKP